MSYPSSRACRRLTSIAVMAALASLGTVVLMPGVASASGTDTWTGAAGNGNWGTAANWAGNAVPGSGDNVIFPAGAPLTVNLNVNATVQNVTIDGDYTFTPGGTLNIVGNSTISQPVSGTDSFFENTIHFAGATSVTTSTGNNAGIGLTNVSGITGPFTIINGSGGALILTGNMTYTASAITIVSGRLQNIGEGPYGTGPITVDLGATILNNYFSIPNNFTISGNAIQTGSQPTLLTGTVTLAADATVGPEPTFQNVVTVGAHTLTISNPFFGVGMPTFSAAVLGTGAVDLTGPSTFLFSGTGTTVPSVVLTSGTNQVLDVTGSMPSTTISAPSGGLIEGTGTIGSVASGGTIMGGSTVSNNAAGGVLTIESQSSLSPSMALQVEDASHALYGSVAVIGVLNLAGATLLQPIDGASSLGDVYTILTSTGALTGTFAGDPDGTVIQDNRGTDFAVHYLANSVTLTDVGPISTSFTASATPSTVAYGTSSTLAESGLDGAATGTVTFASGGSTLCAVTLPATSCTTSPALAGGTYPITATYSGGGLYGGSTTTTTLTVSALATSFTATAAPGSVPFGTTSSLSESGLPGAATGTVTFASGGSTLCTATLPVTACPTASTLAAGTYPITATYSGDANYAGSTAATSLIVTQAATSFTASATPSSVPFGTSSTLAASGLPSGALGTVTFASGAQTLCTATLPSATCPTAMTLAGGTYPITATYSGDANYAGSTAASSLTVTQAATSFTADATPANVSYGTSSSLAESGLPGGATGTVAFVSGSTTLCTALLPATSCLTPTSLGAATYPITATYSGDGQYAGSTASTSLTVGRASTSFTASASPSSVPFGTSTTLAETGLPTAASGTVTFASGGSTWCVATLPATTCTPSALLATGGHPITATYSGDGDFGGSMASTMLTVTVAGTATTVSSSLNPAGPDQRVVYTARVVPNPGSGTISFSANVIAIAGCPAVPINPLTGAATCSTTYAAAGTLVIGAAFSGNANYAASSAATSGALALTETVDAAVTVPSTGSGIEANPGQPVAGGVLALLGFLTVFGARRRRLRP
jgi:hypothetical protein